MSTTAFPSEQRAAIEGRITSVFTPHSPIRHPDFFAGRIEQIRAATDAVTTPGLHVVIFGERGVGKTSLSNILKELLKEVLAASRVNCDHSDSFGDVMRRSLGGIVFQNKRQAPGFGNREEESITRLSDALAGEERISPDHVADVLSALPPYVVLVIDEFDRLPDEAKVGFADLIKALSDRASETTIVLVGVAESVDDLVANHASVERCLRQVSLPRMSDEEMGQILDRGFDSLGFGLSGNGARARIISTSQGFPHYAHLLAQNAARSALDRNQLTVSEDDVIAGMVKAAELAEQSHRTLYYKAVTGTKKKNLWKEVVVACADAESDDRGYFPTRAVQDSLSRILDRDVIQQTVAFHLGKLTEVSRGPLLERIGPERRYRYRFINPLMRPFVLLKAIADGIVDPETGLATSR